MKTAISLPNTVYYEAEATAHDMGVPRSTNRKNITQKLNEVYGDEYHTEFEPIANASLESLRESTKNDTW